MKIDIDIYTKTRHTVTISAQDIREKFNLPAKAEITIRIPGGGDYSNTDLLLDDIPIHVVWEEVK